MKWHVNSGNKTPYGKVTLYGEQGGWTEKSKQRIAFQLSRIRHWKVTLGDYQDAPDIPATWFVDPPYVTQNKAYGTPFTDFIRLSSWCKQRKGLAIVCELHGADWLPFRPIYKGYSKSQTQFIDAVWIGVNNDN